jgi:tripartite-type tricarboxylate transporter receptor subunit TctC
LRPIGRIGISAFALVVPKSLGVATLEQFIARARARPGQLTYASIGYGSSQHLVMEMFCAAAGLTLTHVPYRGESAATPDLMSGRVQAMFMAGAKPVIATGAVVALGTTHRTSWPPLPDLPALGSFPALRGFNYNGWNGLMAPVKTPDTLIQNLSRSLVAALRDDAMLASLRTIGFEPGRGEPEDMAEQIRTDLASFRRIINERHLTFPD